MGIRDRPITPRSPWQNGHVERLIGSIRRECLDHVVVLGEKHLRHLLANHAAYYNGVRTIASVTWLGGFHRYYLPDGIIGRHRGAHQHVGYGPRQRRGSTPRRENPPR